MLNLVICFKSSEFFRESSDFCSEACGSTGLLISVECAPECIVLGIMSGGHWNYLPNRRTVCGPVVQTSVSVKNPRFLRSQVILNYELEIVHNCRERAIISLMYHCKFINKFVLLQKKFAVGL